MERVEITQPMIGICYMQVCAVADATDEEILAAANSLNPSGTHNGWSEVIRKHENESFLPKQCADHSDRIHFLLVC